jgi:DNA-binding NarL/FixJ family response regulator
MLSPAVTRRLIQHVADDGVASRRAQARERLDRLTDREREVAVAIGQGKSNAEIAAELYLSQKTVRNYVSGIFAKLQVADRAEAGLVAREAGLGRLDA